MKELELGRYLVKDVRNTQDYLASLTEIEITEISEKAVKVYFPNSQYTEWFPKDKIANENEPFFRGFTIFEKLPDEIV